MTRTNSMIKSLRLHFSLKTLVALLVLSVLVAAAFASSVTAATQQRAGSVGLEGTVKGEPPSTPPTISLPTNGQSFTSIPITVSGFCSGDLLVKVFSNNVFVGSTQCSDGSYSIRVDLFSGRNDLVAKVYDALGQSSPPSNSVTITFNDAQFAEFGTRVSLSSSFGKKGANPGDTLLWPFILSGGLGPYALSVDWGDGTPEQLKSVAFADTITLEHIYHSAGVYNIIVKATDANGTTAYLQVIGVANGEIHGNTAGSGSSDNGSNKTITKVVWWPALAGIPLIIVAFWLGQRYELLTIRRRLDDSRQQYN